MITTNCIRPAAHRKDNICPSCETAQREDSGAWCSPCRRVKQRASEARRRARKKAGISVLMPQRGRRHPGRDSECCNCGDPACRGLTCDFVRVA